MKIKWIRRFLRVGIFSLYGVILNVVLVAFAILIELFAWEWNDLIYSLFFPYYEIVNSSSAFSTSFIDFTLIAFFIFPDPVDIVWISHWAASTRERTNLCLFGNLYRSLACSWICMSIRILIPREN